MQLDKKLVFVVIAAVTTLGGASRAHAFCRTTTEPIRPDFTPAPGKCFDEGLPVWWRNRCIGYTLQKDASRQIAYNDAARSLAVAFGKWTSASCPNATNDGSPPSIDVRDLGPVACDEVRYNDAGANQNLIVFRDDVWPHNDPTNTLALTTVVYDRASGELYDADMEINTVQHKMSLGDPVPSGEYDFDSIITHEAGHFFGLAHSADDQATMYAHYTDGSTSMRTLAQDDIDGICSIYTPEGKRTIAEAATVDQGACDPTPRHGFTTECVGPANDGQSSACGVAATVGRSGAGAWGWGLAGFGLLFSRVGRRLRSKSALGRRDERRSG
jgi:hypothetical protein